MLYVFHSHKPMPDSLIAGGVIAIHNNLNEVEFPALHLLKDTPQFVTYRSPDTATAHGVVFAIFTQDYVDGESKDTTRYWELKYIEFRDLYFKIFTRVLPTDAIIQVRKGCDVMLYVHEMHDIDCDEWLNDLNAYIGE